MEILKRVGDYTLNKGNGMAMGLYNVSNDILLETTKKDGVSFWFDEETKDDFMKMTDDDFVQTAKQMIEESNY